MEVGRGVSFTPAFSKYNSKKKNKATGFMQLLDPGGTFKPLWEGKFDEEEEYPEFIPYIMPQDTEAGASALPILQSRAKGEGVAFSPEQLTMYGQPYAKAATNIWENYSKPAIEESYASRGLGKSTMAGQAEVQGQRELADLIGVNWSDLNKWNESLKQQGITGGVSGLMDYMGSELNQSNLNTGGQNQYNMGSFNYDLALREQEAQENQNRSQFIGDVFEGIIGGVSGSKSGGGGASAGGGSSDYGAILQYLNNNKQQSQAERYYENQPRSVFSSGNGISSQANNLDYWRNKYKYGGY